MLVSIETAYLLDCDRRSNPIITVSMMNFRHRYMTTCIFSIFSVLLSFFEWASFDKQRQERAIFCAVGLLLSSDPYGPVEDWAYFQIIPLWSVKYFKDEFFLKVWNKVPIYVVSSCFDSGFCSGSSPQSPQCFFHFNLGDFWENWELIESNVQLVSCWCPAGLPLNCFVEFRYREVKKTVG